jgi:hypothetical protein
VEHTTRQHDEFHPGIVVPLFVEQSSIPTRWPTMKRTFADVAATIDQLSGRPLTFSCRLAHHCSWGDHGSAVSFLRHFAARHQHRDQRHRDGAAAKLDELIRVSAARNTLIWIETLTQEEIDEIRATCAAKGGRAVNGVLQQANKKAKAAVNKAMS